MEMENSKYITWCHVIFFFLFLMIMFSFTGSCQQPSYSLDDSADSISAKVYIVQMDARLSSDVPHRQYSLHLNVLSKVVGNKRKAKQLLVYSYKTFNSFAAKLTLCQMQQLSGVEGVVHVHLSKKKKLHTTRSWDFIGFSKHVLRVQALERDIIIGVLDTGIWPESPSFSDEGFGPPPARWKGICETSPDFQCNNKIIGARYYQKDHNYTNAIFVSPRDAEGHGTHTASIAAGGPVGLANLEGFASGTARGGVPSARIAVYKVCWPANSCEDADISAAFDDAIADGVDIISTSLGGNYPVDYFDDSIAIGSFHAMKNGIFTSTAAGNDGPAHASITNFAPWLLSVAASTIDRRFITNVLLANNLNYQGTSVNTFDLKNRMYPLIYGADAPNTAQGFNSSTSRYCGEESLDRKLVKDKIVICDADSKGKAELSAGAAGTLILQDCSKDPDAYVYPLPAASCIGLNAGTRILSYLNSTSNASATILRSNEVPDFSSPSVVDFSSRGPNPNSKDVLKPDLAAPGINILAAWPLGRPPSEVGGDARAVGYNIQSGTSMACPHATGAAAYVKSFHPKWSPAAIKSALMTTASPMDPTANSDAEFAYGAGNINPVRAVHPGLIYDAYEDDYVKYLCSQGYNTQTVRHLSKDNSSCPHVRKRSDSDLNLPSFVIYSRTSRQFHKVFKRTVTNVGAPMGTYVASVTGLQGVKIKVMPKILSFRCVGQKRSFTVTIKGRIKKCVVSASLVWGDGHHAVRSPIVLHSIR